jgi:hypothetical protein
MVALIDQPTTRRENKSSTAATYSQPSAVQMYVKSAIHLRLGAGAWKAERLAFGEYDQLHHFIAAGVWDARPVDSGLLVQADRFVGGSDAVLVIDDTAIPKKGAHSVGVAAQYASALGKTANCQTLVSLTLRQAKYRSC